ncbi:MAG TPA: hypothetical protein PLS34_11780, partial [Gammaproteobacteria bacterium]|nr:hypothetical protein [Gammaproteobacteria bacterium]
MPTHAARPGWSAGLRILLVAMALATFGCGSQQAEDAGHYRIVTVKPSWLGGGCQPRTEFYFVDPQSPGAPLYLGTCGTPQFVTRHLGMPSDPSCFAVARDGSALVYFHRPNWCGAGETAANKPGGVYRHATAEGDALLYSDREHVTQVWTRGPIEPDAIRVAWKNARPSRAGASCSQQLLIRADGSETPVGESTTVHGCPAGRDDAPAEGY